MLLHRIRSDSLITSTLLSILATAPSWAVWSEVAAGCSLLRVSGLLKATAECLRCATK